VKNGQTDRRSVSQIDRKADRQTYIRGQLDCLMLPAPVGG